MPTLKLIRESKEDDAVGDDTPLTTDEIRQYIALTAGAIQELSLTNGTEYPDEYAEAIVNEHGRATPILIADKRTLGIALRNVAFSTRPTTRADNSLTDSDAINNIMTAKNITENSAKKAFDDLNKMTDDKLHKLLRSILAKVSSASKDEIDKLSLLVPVLRMVSLRRGTVGGLSPTELRTLARYSHVRVKSKTPVRAVVPLRDAFAYFDTSKIRAQERNSPEWISAARQSVVEWINRPKAINPKLSRKRMNQLIAFEKDPVTHTLYLLGEATEEQLKSIGANLNYGAHGRTQEFVRLNRYKLMGDTSGMLETHLYLKTYFSALQEMYNSVLKGFMKGAEIGAAKLVEGFEDGVPLVMKVKREDISIIENGKTVHYASYKLMPGHTEPASVTYSYHARVGNHQFLSRLTDTPLPKGPVEKHELSKMIVGCQKALYNDFYGSTPEGVAVRLNALTPFLNESAALMKVKLPVYYRGRVYKKNIGGNLTSDLLAREFVTKHGFYRSNPLLDTLPDRPNEWEKYYFDNKMFFYITKENAEVGLPFPSGVKGRECREQLVEYTDMVYVASQKNASHLALVAPGWDTCKIKRKVGVYDREKPVVDADIADLDTLIGHAQSDTSEARIRVITIPPASQLAYAWYHKGINHDAHILGKLKPPMHTRISCFSHYNFNGGGAHAFIARLLDLDANYDDDTPVPSEVDMQPAEEGEHFPESFAAAVYSDNMNCRMDGRWLVNVDPNVVVVCNTVGAKPGIEKGLTAATRERETYTFRDQDCEGNFAYLSMDGSKAETAFTRQVCENLHMAMINHCGSTPAFRKYARMVGIPGHSSGIGIFGQHSRKMNQNLSGSQSTSVNNSFVSYCAAECMRHYIKVNTDADGKPLKGIHDIIAEVRAKVGVRLTLERVVLAPRNGALGLPGDTIPFDLLGNSIFIAGDGKYHLQLEDARLYRSLMTEKVVYDPDNKKSSKRQVTAAKLGKLISLMLMSCLGNNYRLELFRNEAIFLAGDDQKQPIDYTETDEETEWSFSIDALKYARSRNLNPVTMEMSDIEDFHYGPAVREEDLIKRVSPFAGSNGKGGAHKWAAAEHDQYLSRMKDDVKQQIAELRDKLVSYHATDPRDPSRDANIKRTLRLINEIAPWEELRPEEVTLSETPWGESAEGITRTLGRLDDEAFQAGLQRELRYMDIKVEFKTKKKGGYFITPETISEVLRKLSMPKSLYSRTTAALYSYISAHPDIMIEAKNPELADKIIQGIEDRKGVHEARAVKAAEKADAKARATAKEGKAQAKAKSAAATDVEKAELKAKSFRLNNSKAVVERQDSPPLPLPRSYVKEFLEWVYLKLNKMEYNTQSGKSTENGENLKAYIARAHPKSRLGQGNFEYNLIISEVSLDTANVSPLPEPTKSDVNTHSNFLKTAWQRYAMKHTIAAIKKAGKSKVTWYALEKRQGFYFPPTKVLMKDVAET